MTAQQPKRLAQRCANMPNADTLEHYRVKRDFTQTTEPKAGSASASATLSFVVQKHAARRLHWDFRLEHDGVLWSWAVPKGPSMDTADKRLAVHVEDHPLDYAQFEGTIPAGNYGAGTVEIWDRGSWAPVGDAAQDIARGELKFTVQGQRLNGRFVLIRLKGKPAERTENWLLIKEHDGLERSGIDAEALEATPLLAPATNSGVPGAKRAGLPSAQKPQLATLVDEAPEGGDWISEVKFDGYRLIARKNGAEVQLFTRNGLDWTARLPTIAQAVRTLQAERVMLDGELVALTQDGHSSFPALQAALSAGDDRSLKFYLFDLLHLEGYDLRPCRQDDRKSALRGLSDWAGVLRYSDHMAGDGGRVRREACSMGLEGIICKRIDAPYSASRSRAWLKVKCLGREEFIVLGWTPPGGSRTGLGALQMGYFDADGALHYAGGVGTGYSDAELSRLAGKLKPLAAPKPVRLIEGGEPLDRSIRWVRPELIAEVQYLGWSGGGRLRHAVYLGLREDKRPGEVVRAVPDLPDLPEAPAPKPEPKPKRKGVIVRAEKPKPKVAEIAGVTISHPDRQLWPGLTKLDLANYWQSILSWAMPAVAQRPLALVRCPDGVGGSQQFFQKHAMPGQHPAVHASDFEGHPYLRVDDAAGFAALSQMAAIELHSWGASATDPGRPDRIVLDLDPGDGVAWPDVVAAAHDVRGRLEVLGLKSFCRTTGGKGLHVVVPLTPGAGWATVKPWCQAFAQLMEAEQPGNYVATLPKVKRRGKILVDWLRNGMGATAIASFSPRARPGACVATPLTWTEVTDTLDPAGFTIDSVPARLAKLKRDPWDGFDQVRQVLPQAEKAPVPGGRRPVTIVRASAPAKKR